MRIALIGDLQYKPGEDAEIAGRMRQVAAQKPDLAVFLGDMGCNGATGTLAGMTACKALLEVLECPVAAIFGNHDVEYRPDDSVSKTPERWYRDLFNRQHPWQAVEMDGVFVLCLYVERQPEHTLMTQHALYVSDAQYAWARDQLRAHRHLPTIVFTHAPMAGSGVRCFPPIHSAATDAYLDHGFHAMRWRELAFENPQIRLWCSAHFHMGHDYTAAVTWAQNLVHVSAGVMTSAARDGSRHTRILDIQDGMAAVCTLDHASPHALRQDVVVDLTHGTRPQGNFAEAIPGEVLLGEDRALAAYVCAKWNRAYLVTAAGKLWEYDWRLGELTGAISLRLSKPGEETLCVRDDRLYVRDAQADPWSVGKDDPARFERLSGYVPQASRPEKALAGQTLEKTGFSQRVSREGTYVRIALPEF